MLPSAVLPGVSAGLGATAVVAFAAGLCHDIVLCRAERAAIGALPENELRRTLEAGGFVPKTEESNRGTSDD